MSDQETIAVYDKQTDNYLNLIEQQSTDPILSSFISRIDPGGYVLDLGCGPALSAVVMRDSGLQIDPVDASAEMVRLANEKFNINARKASFDEINSENTYDGIWANFSLLHATATDFPVILTALHRALKRKGILHLGMKTGTGSSRDKLGRYYTYYSQAELCNHLASTGFTVDEITTGEGIGLAGDIETWISISSVADNLESK